MIAAMEGVKLPRGRHRLTREEVLASQRGRMLEAMAAAVREKGYSHTAVADVVAGAGVSRETFYQHFDDKEACFLAAYERGVEAVRKAMAAALAGAPAEPLERFDRALCAYLDLLAESAIARVFLVDVYAAGPRALRRRREVQEDFVGLVAGIFGARTAEQRFACEALVAALSSMVTVRVAGGDVASLPALRAPMVGLARRIGI
jgi:AcrR family transcriptional regulator